MRTLTWAIAVAFFVSCGGTDADGDSYKVPFDCDDTDPDIHPNATEICDGIDNDCDGLIDDEDDLIQGEPWYLDEDGDGFGAGAIVAVCSPPEGAVQNADDCDDTDPDVYPGHGC